MTTDAGSPGRQGFDGRWAYPDDATDEGADWEEDPGLVWTRWSPDASSRMSRHRTGSASSRTTEGTEAPDADTGSCYVRRPWRISRESRLARLTQHGFIPVSGIATNDHRKRNERPHA